jgi:hypothetical protein
MKVLLVVKNKQEYIRVAPILNELGYVWNDDKLATEHNPFNEPYHEQGATYILFKENVTLTWIEECDSAGMYTNAISVDEFIHGSKE